MSAVPANDWRIAVAERMREAMGPEMCAVADALRETFGAKLTWLETQDIQIGRRPGGEPIGEKSYLAKRAMEARE